jgi:nucleotide-binding universal stress UspA family protein
MKILLAVDGSPHTKRMLSYIAAHDELLGPAHEYTAVAVVAAVPPQATRFLQADVLESYYQEQADMVLRPVAAFAEQQGWTFKPMHAIGHAPDAIAELAAAGRYDLIVMGTRGHGALAGAVLGSVTMRVVSQTRTPVLLVP